MWAYLYSELILRIFNFFQMEKMYSTLYAFAIGVVYVIGNILFRNEIYTGVK